MSQETYKAFSGPLTFMDGGRAIFAENPDGTITLAEGATWEEAAKCLFKIYQYMLGRQDAVRDETLAMLRR